MAGSADYILPGHREPIGHWPDEQLMHALEDLLFDQESGFLPPEVAEAVAQLGAELDARLNGDPRLAGASSGIGRALDRWYPAEDVNMPALRGEEGLRLAIHDPELHPGVAAALAADVQPDLEAVSKSPTLSLVWDKEPPEAATPQRDTGIEP